MARTLTEHEQQTLQSLRDRLLRALPSEEKGYAAGIASSLVRIREPKITDADLDRILGKYDTPKDGLLKAIKNQLLKPVHGEAGSYTLRKKDAKALPAGEGAEQDEGAKANAKQGESKRTSGERKPRRRSHRSGTKAAASPAMETNGTEAGEGQDGTPGDTQKAGAKTSTGTGAKADIAPGRSIRKATQADNEADEAAVAAGDEPAESASEATAAPKKPARASRSRRRKKTDATGQAAPPEATPESASDEVSPTELAESAAADGTGATTTVSNAAESESPSPATADSDEVAGTDAHDAEQEAAEGSADTAERTEDAHNEDNDTAQLPASNEDASNESTASTDDVAPADAAPSDKEHSSHGHGKRKKNERDPRRIPYVRRGDEDDAALREKIIQLDQRFWMNGWLLSHPGAYAMFEHELTTLSDALADGDVLPGDITRRQLAYQLGGDEKFFEYGSDGFRLLRAMGMESIIRRRPLPKIDLVYHAPRRRKRMRVLVTENLDPYLDVHDLMYEDGRSLFLGERIHAVVLGGGTPVLEHNRLSLLLDTLGADHIDVLYWGDIDRAGLELMCKLKDILGDKYGFEPFTPAYRLMVQRAMERFPDPADNELTGQENVEILDTDLLCMGLSDEEAAYARAVIESCCLIPQEILTKRDL